MLAAGAGRRFGGGKLLAPFRGAPLIQGVLGAVTAARTAGLLAGGVVTYVPEDLGLAALIEAADLTPVLVGRDHWPLAERLQGEQGFAAAVAARGLAWREVWLEGANPDVDTRADLERLEQ